MTLTIEIDYGHNRDQIDYGHDRDQHWDGTQFDAEGIIRSHWVQSEMAAHIKY